MNEDELIEYEMAFLQFAPVLDSEERLNIGVLLHAPASREIAGHFSDKYRRLTALYPLLDGFGYRKMIHHLQARVREIVGPPGKAQQMRLLRPDMNMATILSEVIRSPSSNFKWSSIRYGVCEDLQKRSQEVFAEYIGQWESQRQRERVDDAALWEHVRNSIPYRRIAERLDHSVHVSAPLYEYTFRAGWQNGTRQVVEPISLDYVNPGNMVEEANKWRGRLEELRRGADFRLTAIVTDRPSGASRIKYDHATQLLRQSPLVRDVFEESQVPAFADLVLGDLFQH